MTSRTSQRGAQMRGASERRSGTKDNAFGALPSVEEVREMEARLRRERAREGSPEGMAIIEAAMAGPLPMVPPAPPPSPSPPPSPPGPPPQAARAHCGACQRQADDAGVIRHALRCPAAVLWEVRRLERAARARLDELVAEAGVLAKQVEAAERRRSS